MKFINSSLILAILLVLPLSVALGGGGSPGGLEIEWTIVKFDISDESIGVDNNLDSLESGFYDFVVSNNTNNKIVFNLQDRKTEKIIRKVKIKANSSKSIKYKVSKNGVRVKSSIHDEWIDISVN